MGFPIQIVRALTAVMIMISLIRATQMAEAARQRQFIAAQQARVEALEQVQLEMENREALRQELLRHTVVAQEEERARIARELHDETSQTLTAFSLHLAALRDVSSDCPEVGERLGQLQSLIRQVSRNIYSLIHDLRPAHLDDLGLVPALQYLCDEARERLSLHVQLTAVGERRKLDPLVETVIFRIAQEALTNVARHAQVDKALIKLEYAENIVYMRVQDQGVGFDLDIASDSRWGLAGMQERAGSVGAKLEIKSSIGDGTIVEFKVPIEEQPVSSFQTEPI
jgi:two-component system sensor histidine kinase UhpB